MEPDPIFTVDDVDVWTEGDLPVLDLHPAEMFATGAATRALAFSPLSLDRLLSRLHGLNPVEAAKMRATCEKLEAAAPREGHFAKLIHDSLDESKRLNALRALHSVMRADGVERPEEENVLIETSVALGFANLPTDLSRRPDPL